MSNITAIYEHGLLRPLTPLSLAENSTITIELQPLISHDLNGQPIITDTVISVGQVAERYQAGLSAEQISHELPLTLAQVHTAIAYYLLHQGEIKTLLQTKKALASRATTAAFQQMLAMATDLGVTDLAEQHDHYLYGVDRA